MRHDLKHALAHAVIVAAADMIDDWPGTVRRYPELSDIEPDEAAEVVSHWLRTLPGHEWDDRLPEEDWR